MSDERNRNVDTQGDETPERIAHYRILEKLGEGGMAEVYLAEQSEPVKRRVALKMLKAGMDSKQIVARFESERQALAVLDHPNIAKVFDGGIAESGRPYFVMERVKGVPITEYCDEHRLSTEARLRVFIDVCAAVQHAHLKGLIHRDLKPSNILVGIVDGKPQPKIIDFGIAKATTTTLTEATLYTRIGQIVGTPQYMSPEQADQSGVDIDTRADVYSLGVILYELLIGTVPIDLMAIGDEAIRVALREKEPPKPSTRYTELRDTRDEIARVRATDPDALRRELKGDLDWIVMKAIEKDRTRRYETVNALAMECRRFLKHEPVLARPPSPGYLLRRFVKRNRTVVVAGSVAVVAVIAGAIAATIGMFRAIEAERVAVTEAATAREVSRFLVDLFGSSDPFAAEQLPGDISARDLVERGAERLESELADRPAIRARLLNALGAVIGNLGDAERASELVDEAFRIRSADPSTGPADLASSHAVLGNLAYGRGDYERSIEHFETALELNAEAGTPDRMAVADALEWIASSYTQLSQYAGARDALERSRAILMSIPEVSTGRLASNVNALGLVLYTMGDYKGASRAFENAVGYYDNLPKTGLYARAVSNLASTYQLTGRLDLALERHEEALELKRQLFGPRHIEIAYSYNNVATLNRDLGYLDEAQAQLERAIDIFAESLGEDHANVAVVRIGLGKVLAESGHYDRARTAYTQALDVVTDAFGEGSIRVIQALNGLAYLTLEEGRRDEAENLFRDAARKAEALEGSHPELGRSYVGLASIPSDSRSPEDRERLFTDGIRIIDGGAGRSSVEAANARLRYARFLRALGRPDRARAVATEALDSLEAAFGKDYPRYQQYAAQFAKASE